MYSGKNDTYVDLDDYKAWFIFFFVDIEVGKEIGLEILNSNP